MTDDINEADITEVGAGDAGSSDAASSKDKTARGRRRLVQGKVISDKMDKTITVRQDRLVKHPLYGKYVRRKTIYKAHDERNEASMGDVVEIVFTRPISKSKCWRLVRIVRRPRLATIGETGGSSAASEEDA